MKALIFFLSLLWLSCLSAQEKIERELRIDYEEVPKPALDFVEKLDFDRKVRWYKEYQKNGFSFEAKSTEGGRLWSVEFSAQGALEDVEIKIKQRNLASELRAQISSHLKEEYGKYRIHKVQLQLKGEDEILLDFLDDLEWDEEAPGIERAFELVVSAKVDGRFQMFEYLFDPSGKVLLKQALALKNSDNIEY